MKEQTFVKLKEIFDPVIQGQAENYILAEIKEKLLQLIEDEDDEDDKEFFMTSTSGLLQLATFKDFRSIENFFDDRDVSKLIDILYHHCKKDILTNSIFDTEIDNTKIIKAMSDFEFVRNISNFMFLIEHGNRLTSEETKIVIEKAAKYCSYRPELSDMYLDFCKMSAISDIVENITDSQRNLLSIKSLNSLLRESDNLTIDYILSDIDYLQSHPDEFATPIGCFGNKLEEECLNYMMKDDNFDKRPTFYNQVKAKGYVIFYKD